MHTYKDSNQLYIDFMLNKIPRDRFLGCIVLLSESERRKLFSMGKMQIFERYYEKMVLAKNQTLAP